MIQLEDIVTNRKERSIYESFYEHGNIIPLSDMMPGHYYSLESPIPNFNESWLPNSEEQWKENPNAFITNKPYLDMRPTGLVFYHDNWKETALILDLKVIPPKYRAALVIAHINIIKDSLEKLNVFSEGDIPSIQERKAMSLPLFRMTPSILEQYSGIKIGYAMTGIKMDKIKEARFLDWNKIGELPLANIDNSAVYLSQGMFDMSSIFAKFENKQF